MRVRPPYTQPNRLFSFRQSLIGLYEYQTRSWSRPCMCHMEIHRSIEVVALPTLAGSSGGTVKRPHRLRPRSRAEYRKHPSPLSVQPLPLSTSSVFPHFAPTPPHPSRGRRRGHRSPHCLLLPPRLPHSSRNPTPRHLPRTLSPEHASSKELRAEIRVSLLDCCFSW